ncbi:hypothetical protein RND81_11G155100 [Saponaria officinalis]|uniref:Uncharacterized protein n=1 Tax=Saponaria officinalis TaxID=3572 RepID=A0AAW1HNJ1_SAPOF
MFPAPPSELVSVLPPWSPSPTSHLISSIRLLASSRISHPVYFMPSKTHSFRARHIHQHVIINSTQSSSPFISRRAATQSPSLSSPSSSKSFSHPVASHTLLTYLQSRIRCSSVSSLNPHRGQKSHSFRSGSQVGLVWAMPPCTIAKRTFSLLGVPWFSKCSTHIPKSTRDEDGSSP